MKYERIVQVNEGKTEETSPVVKITLTVEQEELVAPYNAYLERIKRTRKFNGFRPGKVPNYIVEGKFGKEATSYAITNIVEYHVRTIAKEHNDKVMFRPIFQPAQNQVLGDEKQPMVFDVVYFRKVADDQSVGPVGETHTPVFMNNPDMADVPKADLILPETSGEWKPITPVSPDVQQVETYSETSLDVDDTQDVGFVQDATPINN